ncbi:MAG TPA: type II secretion system protein [Dehalococcoidales bacterium]|nr:type II secretion system protein [Dehalococcoidales bacterium]
MKKFLKKFRYGEKGFTLIELLVVVAILGVLAAVIVPNVGRFIGKGTIESANTEAHNVEMAVIAHMADEILSDFNGTVGPDVTVSPHPEDFLVNPGGLQAVYTIADGTITGAVKIADSMWGDLLYDPATGWQ